MKQLLSLCLLALSFNTLFASDGHELWLRNRTARPVQVSAKKSSQLIQLAMEELQNGWMGEPNARVKLSIQKDKLIKGDGFRLRNGEILAATERGLLYGVYELLRRQYTGQTTNNVNSNPSYDIRILNHWDNLDGSIERGYAGKSIFWRTNNAFEVTESDKQIWAAYARANASIGINGSVLNNVNASPLILSTAYLQRVKAIASVLRPYGIKVYLSVKFSSPVQLGGLKTADPLDPTVVNWWKEKVKEIYSEVPDFGGLLVKANSEGQPGPQDYGRSHADGANMLADAVKPFGGIVMWRAFVYAPNDKDRAKQAYTEFVPLDEQFRNNVIIQVKNGPVDFQPREPFSPLFGALKKTSVMPELQITQEYLGHSVHLVFLGTMWEELLKADTYQKGAGSTVAKVTDGSVYDQSYTAIAGVANIGSDTNWCGHYFAQSNWYAFGRLAWNNQLTSKEIAEEWLQLCFPNDSLPADDQANWTTNFLEPVLNMMLASREAAVNYMMPLGLHHIMSANEHYGPGPWWAPPRMRADWTPPYYHQAAVDGVGFNRSSTGSNAVAQYAEPLASRYNDITTCPEDLLLWFHHASWTHKMKSGKILWDELCYKYQEGVEQVRAFQIAWDKLHRYMDSSRFTHVQEKLRSQSANAVLWRDACLLYFQQFSRLPIPYELERPVHNLTEMIEQDNQVRRFPGRMATGPRTLRLAYQFYFPIGVAVSPRALKTDEAGLIAREFSSLTAENAMKMQPIQPREGEFNWAGADSILAYAGQHQLKMRGHTLCWHNQAPEWMFVGPNGKPASRELLLQRLKTHITTVVNRYKGKIYAWDVVNEAISDKKEDFLRPSKWLQIIGESYIDSAFLYAHAADPDAVLFYNDYDEINPVKRAKIIKLITRLIKSGIPVQGIGLQGHWAINEPSKEQLDSTLQEFGALGLQMQITELDISVYPKEHQARARKAEDDAADFTPEREAAQLEKYKIVFELFRKYRSQITGVTFWNISDRGSWLDNFPVRGRKDYPLLFDKNLKPKSAYEAVVNFQR